eukprot:jgi/Astpho2/8280/Aster-01362
MQGSVLSNMTGAKMLPITALSPYQTQWHIKVRVTSPTEMRRCAAFIDTADRVSEGVQQSKVYIISKASLKPKDA